jgi:release factor glutamine methyltransferase
VTLKEIYSRYLRQLQLIYPVNEASIITDRVFVSAAGIHRSDLIKYPLQSMEDNLSSKLNGYLQELLDHKPVQYVLGETWFYDMRLKVNEHTLIPRPETEELVKLAIDHYRDLNIEENEAINLLDIGTGSGCIAIAIKKNLPGIKLTAIDVSPDALTVSEENASAQEVDVEFLQMDFLDEQQWKNLPAFHGIISNPPYIPLHEREKMDKNVTAFEPAAALFVPDESPLLFYEKIAAFAKDHLLRGGKIFLEVNEALANDTAKIFGGAYPDIQIKKDLFDKERIVVVTKGKPE